MGRDIKCITKHTLPVHSIDALLEDLSNRFNANVFFVFPSHVNLDEYLENINLYDLKHNIEIEGYVFKKIIKDSNLPNLTVCEDEFVYRFLKSTFGEEAGFLPDFIKVWSSDGVENNDIINGFCSYPPSYDLFFEDYHFWFHLESGTIYHDDYFGRWWDLFRTLLEGDEADRLQQFLHYRKRNIEIARLFGGYNAYYIDNQSRNTGIGQGNEDDMTWKEIEKEISSGVSGQNLIDLKELLTNKEYHAKYVALAAIDCEAYSIFYDDFSEIALEDVEI